jgi:MoaA/NifB/PqqE/SkfB family radical SAM enzyme
MKVDRGFNLYVDITAACNASCPFCIAPTIGRIDGPKFMDGLVYGLDFTQKHSGSVQITGGEPSLSRRLPAVLAEVGKRPFHRKVLNSNGCGFSIGGVDEMAKAGITHVNLSRHHYVEHKNQEIMRFSHAEWGNNERFIKAVKMIHAAGILVRVNCNILAGYIDSVVEMLRFIDWCESFGVYSVSFSETFPLGVFDHNLPIEPGYAERMAVDLRHIVSELCVDFSSTTRPDNYRMSAWGGSNWISPYEHGGHRRFWDTQKGGQFSIKTLAGWNSDGTPKAPSYSKIDDPELRKYELYFAVVHPDGTVSASWDKRERILYAPQEVMPIQMFCPQANSLVEVKV